jgi:16S rRNA (guanine966-N2)-methyltransferase
MKDRVREALFNLLGYTVKGAIALDLFAGTGALGFEALSRGATAAWFGERHFPTADCLRRSAKALDVEDRTTIRPGDVLLWARRMPEIPRTAPWIAFVSPPWEMFATHTAELMALVSAVTAAAPPGSQIVVEAEMSFDPVALPEPAAWTPRPIPPALLLFREL